MGPNKDEKTIQPDPAKGNQENTETGKGTEKDKNKEDQQEGGKDEEKNDAETAEGPRRSSRTRYQPTPAPDTPGGTGTVRRRQSKGRRARLPTLHQQQI